MLLLLYPPERAVLKTILVNKLLPPTWLVQTRVTVQHELLQEVLYGHPGQLDLELLLDLKRQRSKIKACRW